MNPYPRVPARGIVAVRANYDDGARGARGILAELQQAFATFRERNESRVGDLEAALDDMTRRLAALQVGGAGDIDAGSPGQHAKARVNLGKFAKTGDLAALNNGLSVNASMSETVDPEGGYTVPEELAGTIVSVQRNSSAMRRLALVIPTRSDIFNQPVNLGGTGSGWAGEKEARPETDAPTFANISIAVGEVYANPAVTQSLLDDSAYNIGDFITREIADTFNEQEGAAFITGNGLKRPSGLLTGTPTNEADSVRAFGTLQYHPTGDASSFAATNPGDALIDLLFKLKAKYRQNASWLMNSTTMSTVSKFKDGQGNYLWSRSMSAGTPDLLLGRPVEPDEDMPDVGANAFPIAVGDFRRGYLITDRMGTRILRDPYTNKPYVMFYATKRVGGARVDSQAIKLLKVAAS